MSKNGAEIDIQSFLSDGAALPRETEMRTRRFAHSTRLLALHVLRKTHSLHDTRQSQLSVGRERIHNDNLNLCLCQEILAVV